MQKVKHFDYSISVIVHMDEEKEEWEKMRKKIITKYKLKLSA